MWEALLSGDSDLSWGQWRHTFLGHLAAQVSVNFTGDHHCPALPNTAQNCPVLPSIAQHFPTLASIAQKTYFLTLLTHTLTVFPTPKLSHLHHVLALNPASPGLASPSLHWSWAFSFKQQIQELHLPSLVQERPS